MRSKSPLVMMEQIIMVLVFSLATAVCVQMFVLSERLSTRYEATDRAVIEAQNLAETLKNGTAVDYMNEQNAVMISEDVWQVWFDTDWNIAKEEQRTYYLELRYNETQNRYCWNAEITVFMEDGTVLFQLPVAGQKKTEVAVHEEP